MQKSVKNMQNSNKINTYIGFSVKSGQIIYGIDTLIETRKHVKLILLCSSLAQNSTQKINEFAKSRNIPVVVMKDVLLEDVVHKKNCKVIGLLNKNLAQAILSAVQEWTNSPKGGDKYGK